MAGLSALCPGNYSSVGILDCVCAIWCAWIDKIVKEQLILLQRKKETQGKTHSKVSQWELALHLFNEKLNIAHLYCECNAP